MSATKPLLIYAGLLVGSVLAACTVGPDYTRPEFATPASFVGQAATYDRHATSATDLASWWQGFQDPELTRFVERALAQNLDLAQARARLTQAQAAFRGASAALLPQGDLQTQTAWEHQSVQTPLGQVLNSTPNFDRNGEYYEADLGASWELDVFGGLRRGKEAALAEYQASQAGVVATRLSVAAQTADIYITIRGLQSRLNIARQQVDTRQKLLATVQLQYAKGLAAQLQVQQAEGALAQAAATIPVLETGLDSAMNALDVMVGTQPGTSRAELDTPAPIPVAPRLADTGTPADLIQRRPDLIEAERELAAANARIGVAISGYYPTFSLGALIGSATTMSSGLFTNGANQAEAIFGLRWRLFDFGRVDAEIAAAKGRDAEALAAYRLAVLRASQDVEDALSALVKYESEEQILTRGETSLAHARNLSMAAYKGGVVSLIEVLNADSSLLQTQDLRAQAQTQAASSAVASFLALGGGWDTTRPMDSEGKAVAELVQRR